MISGFCARCGDRRLYPGLGGDYSGSSRDLIEGVYDFEMTNYRGAMWVMRDVELTGGRFEKEFDLTEEDFGW